mmetsp:Transcript_13645/g.53815  ORF Transcript_13645/g.53815 Transcript_13645/m.53815 type:complete len:201 (+) Transcript_13645:307-909(+)
MFPCAHDRLALPVQVLEDGDAEVLRLEQSPLAVPDPIAGSIQLLRRLRHAVALRRRRRRAGVVELGAREELRAVVRLVRRAGRQLRLALEPRELRLVIPELVQHGVLRRGVLLGPGLEVHAADERLGLGDVRLRLADLLNLGISGERGQRRGVPRDGRGELEELLLVRVEDLWAWGRWGGDAVRVSTFVGPVEEKRRRRE